MIYPQNYETKIGFDSIRELLANECLSTLGKQKVEEMQFSAQADAVERQLDETTEFMRILQEEDSFPDQFFFDVRTSLKRIRVEGLYLEEEELFNLLRSLETISGIVHFLLKKEEGDDTDETEAGDVPYPALYRLAGDVLLFPQFILQIKKVVDKYGKIKDDASAELSRIRRELASTVNSISHTLANILRSAQSEGLVEKDVAPAVRDGRLVIPVAPALKRKIKGIVHDESASGKTVFIEPAQVVEANNRIRELESEEKREVIRILTEISNALRPSIPELLQSYDFLATIDFIRAKARFAIRTGSVKPALEQRQLIDWSMAVHPLLQMSLAKHGKKVVPLEIELNDKQRILLISGPNAGGKSVCLKTVGLLQYMLQCGMPVPMSESSHAGLFDSIFIDIGDEQSIEDDLSTYSSHLTNMKVMMKQCNERSLILIDEFGGGTEPQIGGAIAEAVLKRFNEHRTFGVITTHYQNLKHYADDHEGIVNGAMLYDRHLMKALFQLQIGNPGSSFAVEIARNIGLPEDVIADASELVGSEYINADKYLQDIVRDKRYWENKRQLIHQKEKKLEEITQRYQSDMEKLQTERKEIITRAKEEAQQLLMESNSKIENTIRAIKEAQADKEKTRNIRQQLDAFKEKVNAEEDDKGSEHIDRQMERMRERQKRYKERKENRNKDKKNVAAAVKPVEEKKMGVGDTVRIKGQTSVGTISEMDDKKAIVVFGAVKTSVDLKRLERTTATEKKEPMAATFVSKQTQEEIHEKKLNFKQDIDVRGMRGDEAVQAVTYFIDDAILLGLKRVRILHGTGTGILRTLIRQYLQTVPGVAHFADEHVQFGGAGITVVELE
jgi:DNA mismatch repair protein MutS2